MERKFSLTTPGLISKLVEYFILIVEAALLLRFTLKLFGANRSADFVQWVYATTDPLLAPFAGMFPSPVIEQGLVLEFSTLFAIVIYALLGWIVQGFIILFSRYTNQKPKEG